MTVMPCEHLLTVIVINRWHEFMEKLHRARVGWVALFPARFYDFDAGVDQEHSEYN